MTNCLCTHSSVIFLFFFHSLLRSSGNKNRNNLSWAQKQFITRVHCVDTLFSILHVYRLLSWAETLLNHSQKTCPDDELVAGTHTQMKSEIDCMSPAFNGRVLKESTAHPLPALSSMIYRVNMASTLCVRSTVSNILWGVHEWLRTRNEASHSSLLDLTDLSHLKQIIETAIWRA